jgi:hypothetical protein
MSENPDGTINELTAADLLFSRDRQIQGRYNYQKLMKNHEKTTMYRKANKRKEEMMSKTSKMRDIVRAKQA